MFGRREVHQTSGHRKVHTLMQMSGRRELHHHHAQHQVRRHVWPRLQHQVQRHLRSHLRVCFRHRVTSRRLRSERVRRRQGRLPIHHHHRRPAARRLHRRPIHHQVGDLLRRRIRRHHQSQQKRRKRMLVDVGMLEVGASSGTRQHHQGGVRSATCSELFASRLVIGHAPSAGSTISPTRPSARTTAVGERRAK